MPFAVEDPSGSAISAEWQTSSREAAATAFSAVDAWPDSIGDRLFQLLRLPVGWDGHGARPPSRTIVDYACYLLARLTRPGVPPPFVAPLSSGGLQLEWHRKGWDLEIEIEGPGQLYVYANELATDQEWEAELTDDLTELQPKLEAIAD
jgi:hypothetical protein